MAQSINLEQLNLPYGAHRIKVKATAQGYVDSNYSNEIVYNFQPHIQALKGVLKCTKIRPNVTSIKVYSEADVLLVTANYNADTAESPFEISLVAINIESGTKVYIVCEGEGVADNRSNLIDPYVPGVNFATDSWEVVAQESQRIAEYFSENGELPESPYKVGDIREISLSTGEKFNVAIMGFCHDDLNTEYESGATKAGISIAMIDCLKATQTMHSSNVNKWDTCRMRTSQLPTYLSQLPSDLQAVIQPVRKKTSAGSSSATIIQTVDSLWLPSLEEVHGYNYYSAGNMISRLGEGTQYEYYKNADIPSGFSPRISGATKGTFIGNGASYTTRLGTSQSTSNNYYYNRNSYKGLGISPTSSINWWLRSPYSSGSTYFVYVNSLGNANPNIASHGYGVSFGFCI